MAPERRVPRDATEQASDLAGWVDPLLAEQLGVSTPRFEDLMALARSTARCRACAASYLIEDLSPISEHRTSAGLTTYLRCPKGHAVVHVVDVGADQRLDRWT